MIYGVNNDGNTGTEILSIEAPCTSFPVFIAGSVQFGDKLALQESDMIA